MKKSAFFLFAVTMFCATASIAQKQLSDAETQDFFRLIRQTKEYKDLKATTDSINDKHKDQVPQEVDIHIVKRENGATDDYIFTAVLERTVMGAALEKYVIEYNKQKKQLVSLKKQQINLQME